MHSIMPVNYINGVINELNPAWVWYTSRAMDGWWAASAGSRERKFEKSHKPGMATWGPINIACTLIKDSKKYELIDRHKGII